MSNYELNSLSNDNDRTLRSYQDKTELYIEATPPIDETIESWINDAVGHIPRDGKILEVGSGFGRDAEYIQAKGYDIECSDAVPNFVELLQEKGLKAHLFNLLRDDFPGTYDMVVADAVLLHFTPEETAEVLRKIHRGLNDDGIFALRMKRGDGPVWSEEKLGEPRYFYYWQPEKLKETLADNGFVWIDMTESYTSHNNASWMHIIAQKTFVS